jgi:hypothetical protein
MRRKIWANHNPAFAELYVRYYHWGMEARFEDKKKSMNDHPPYCGFYPRHGVITPEVYAAARQLSGDREFRSEDENVRLAGMSIRDSYIDRDAALRLDPKKVIGIWKAALAECREEFGEGRFVLESVGIYLDLYDFPGDYVWRKNANAHPQPLRHECSDGRKSLSTSIPISLRHQKWLSHRKTISLTDPRPSWYYDY